MNRKKGTKLVFLIVGLVAITPLTRAKAVEQSEREAKEKKRKLGPVPFFLALTKSVIKGHVNY